MSEFPSIPLETKQAQGRASDPDVSAWVSANAGSGKTFVLSRRVIRLLLSGVKPAKILCLTFTKAAAAEMSNRVFRSLGEWVAMDEATLSATLLDLLGREATTAEMARARTLFAASLDTPGGLKIQTIHAFCEALLHQFPLEANISGHFKVIEEGQQEELLAEARTLVIRALESGTGGATAESFRRLISLATDDAIDRGVKALLARREEFLAWSDGDPAEAMAPSWLANGLAPDEPEEAVIARGLGRTAFQKHELSALAAIAAREGGAQNEGFARRVADHLAARTPAEAFRTRNKLWLTTENEARKNPITKKAVLAAGDLAGRIDFEIAFAIEECRRVEARRVLLASEALFVHGDAILRTYLSLKRRRGLADFDDLIAAARNLMLRSDVRAWVQFKLDRGIDHVLVDEAQDTSPRQWDIVNAIVEEFHAGKGASDRVRTMFAVGDEKQSIYSFQGADPRKFSSEAASLEKRTRQARLGFHQVALNLSFRSTPDILDAVDRVFAEPDNFRGLSATETRTVHAAIRRSDPGEVQIWPVVARTGQAEKTEWLEPLDKRGEEHPAEILAERIAATIHRWIDNGERLPGRTRKLRCGDILVLVRRRDAFSTAIIRRLKEKGLAIAGADRLRLTDHIAVEDLLALGRVMLIPEDDLSLAGVLKSPLFGVTDDDLVALAAGRGGEESLYDHLALLGGDPQSPVRELAMAIRTRIDRLRAAAAFSPPYEFYAHVLGREGGRRAFLSRLGTEAADVLDAFEQAAMGHERAGLGGLEDFIAALTRSSPEVKREVDMKDNEIRVITVHSAKGLEAPVVFLVDPCTPAFNNAHRPPLVDIDAGGETGFLWAPFSRAAVPAIVARDEQIRQDAEDEYRRLLYVGMTRAADRLVVCGWRGVRAPKHPHWHAMIEKALAPEAETVEEPDGVSWLRWRSARPETAAARKPRTASAEEVAAATAERTVPAWLRRDVAPEPATPRPLSPSQASALFANEIVAQTAAPAAAPAGRAEAARRFALERGTLTHKLLEFAPQVAAEKRAGFIERMLTEKTAGWPPGASHQLRAEVEALLADHVFGPLFGPGSRAEVPVAGHVAISGRRVLVSGQIDRIAVTPDEVLIADFKTNASIPAAPEEAPEAYVIQLALYRALLLQIYPAHAVRCFLVWTRSPSAMEISPAQMDAALASASIRDDAAVDASAAQAYP